MSKDSKEQRVSNLACTFRSAKTQTTLTYRKFITLIALVPEGSVATYGQIAKLGGRPGHARQVVRALYSSSEKYGLPWHRIVNAQGKIGIRNKREHLKQKSLLKREGIKFDHLGKINLPAFRWTPKTSELTVLFKALK